LSLQAVRDAVASKLGLTKDQAAKTLTAVAEAIKENVGTANVTIAPLGNFKVKHREARTGRNPQTGEAIQIAAKSELTLKSKG
jgi:nucleoid DNA-binding protein